MSMHPAPWPGPDPQVAAMIEAKFPGRKQPPLAVTVRGRLGEWLQDEDFAVAFGVRGRLGWSPSRLALVTVLQRSTLCRNGRDAAAPVAPRGRCAAAVPGPGTAQACQPAPSRRWVVSGHWARHHGGHALPASRRETPDPYVNEKQSRAELTRVNREIRRLRAELAELEERRSKLSSNLGG
jgi:hypothetical protein